MSASDRGRTGLRPAIAGVCRRSLHRLRRARYRCMQMLRGVRPHISPGEAAEVRRRLNQRELLLFVSAEARDRRHSIALFKHLLSEGARRGRYPSEAMLVAALLHDVGKGRVLAWHRAAFVLLNALSPRLARALEAEHGASWRVALRRLRDHAALGARLLRAAGSDARVIEIVAAHTGTAPEGDEEIRWFIEADDRV